MMKNKMMRAASILLVAVLLSTCAISGTFAKYVTTASGTDTARVAKFGVVIQADGSLYGQYYQADPNNKPTATADGVSVSAVADAVAPGTKSDKGLNFSINGTPEVRTKLDVKIVCENIFLKVGTYAVMVEAPTVTSENWASDTYYTLDDGIYTLQRDFDPNVNKYYIAVDKVTIVDYYPVVYKSTDKTDGTIENDSLSAIVDYYAQKFNNNTPVTKYSAADWANVLEQNRPEDYAVITDAKTTYTITEENNPNFDYSGLGVGAETLTWEWAIETGSDDTEKKMYNGADTILAQLQAGAAVVKISTENETTTGKTPTKDVDYHLNTSLGITITVTQVD